MWPAHARATAPRHLLACLPALPSSPRCPWTTPRLPPALSHSPPALPSSPSLSLQNGRTPPSPPFATAAVSGHPSLPRLAQELRLDPLFPLHRPRAPRKPCIAATSPFPSSGSDRRRRRIHRHQRVPEPANHPCSSAVSPRIVSPFFPGLSRPLGPSPTLAESSTPPAMSPSWPRSP